tara:strand:+ start:12097 stop:12447 length:351 start_codon:yes stop_codon:yes gene_type:complete
VNNSNTLGPLRPEDINKIESSDLSNLEKHHLRLLAHCLATFKAIPTSCLDGSLPSMSALEQWCLSQPEIFNDPGFIAILMEQFSSAIDQLNLIAKDLKKIPLDLTLEDLILVNSKK